MQSFRVIRRCNAVSARSFSKQNKFSVRTFATPNTARVFQYDTFGSPQSVIKQADVPLPKVGESDVLVKMLAAPVNPADLNMVEGTYGVKPQLPAVGGNEGVGIVVSTGSRVQGLNANDHVIPATPGLGTWRTYGVFKSSDLIKVPSDIKPEYAATVSVNPCTAIRLLEDFEKLKAGDVIIQNGANSMVGTAVIQIAKQKGVKTINVVRQRSDFDAVHERLKNIGAHMVVSDEYIQTAQFKRLLSDMAAPKLALNCVGGQSATDIARTLAKGGTMVTYGGMSRKPITIPTSLLIFKDIQLKGFWLTKWIEEHSAEERQAMLNQVFELIRSDKLKLFMERQDFNADALQQVFKYQRDRKVVMIMQ